MRRILKSLATLTGFACGAVVCGQSSLPPPLDDAELATRRGHWAWQPLADVHPVDHVHPVDGFVRERLRAHGLAPSPPAAPHVQLRRLWLDLVGLPPSPAAIERFTENPSDAAWRREVDELLASPHFGERWARHWLDLMRYSETLGHEYDFEIPNAWRYRDYVIRAFNADVPYDQFVREHIAGDLLPHPRRAANGDNESVQATASWWFVEQTHSPVDAMQHQADRIDNQLDVFGKAFLSLTIACARCHDHKFDAIPTRDYYGLFGFVQSSRYVQAPLHPVDPAGDGYRAALAAQRDLARVWLPDGRAVCDAADATGVSLRPEDQTIATAERPGAWFLTNDGFGHTPWLGPFCPEPGAEEPELIRLPGPFWLSAAAGARREGTLASPTFALAHRYVHVRVAGRASRIKLIVDGLHVVRDPIYGQLHRNIDEPRAHWQTFDVDMWRGRSAYLQAIDQRAPDLGDPRHNRGQWPANGWLAVQSVILSPHATPPPCAPVAEPLRADAARTRAEFRSARARLGRAIAALPISPTLPAMADGTGVDSYVYLRGSHRLRGAEAPRGFLTALPAIHASVTASGGSGRLALADAVLAPDNPLPARVLVNRVWHHLFGRGLVKSVDNFGALGDRPSHPELLDWLARDFIAHGWSIKHAIRRVVTSATYRQASRRRDDARETDPDNVLLHRQNVRPLEAEIVRDTLLAVSGRLDPKMFGPSIEQPAEAITDARGKPNRHDPRDGRGRRSIYLAVRRNFMPQMMLAFDQPTPFATVGRRNTSNVPAQALALANAPLVHDLCALLRDRVLAHADDPGERIDFAFRLLFARPPRADERQRVLDFATATGEQQERWFDAMHALVNTTEFRFCR